MPKPRSCVTVPRTGPCGHSRGQVFALPVFSNSAHAGAGPSFPASRLYLHQFHCLSGVDPRADFSPGGGDFFKEGYLYLKKGLA